MANIKSQIKRDRTNAAANARNSSAKAALRTAVKKVSEAVKANDKAAAEVALNHASSLTDKAAQSGIIAKNTASRKKSALNKLVNSLN